MIYCMCVQKNYFFKYLMLMNQQRHNKISRLIRHLKQVIHTDNGSLVRRRDLLSSRQGDIQLELDFGDTRGALARQRWLEGGVIEPSILH
ncbi:MAG TPA: hypothetical protein DCP71_00350 [Verrucomicrobiales bacterium]|nr:hypothetical protein [Verrucomicrobiales bacterium]